MSFFCQLDRQGGMTMTRRRSVATFNLDEVSTRFENWRQNRRSKQRIPEELWSAAIEAARRGGVNRVSAARRHDRGKFKRRNVHHIILSGDRVSSTCVSLN